MKVEKINDNQIQFVLMPQDLAARNISINDIISRVPGKADVLFQEITSILSTDYQFSVHGTPLVFEARASHDSIYIMVTRIDASNLNGYGGFVNGVMTQMAQAQQSMFGQQVHNTAFQPPPIQPKNKTQAIRQSDNHYAVFSFENIDILAEAAAQIGSGFLGRSKVYKVEGKHYLLLHSFGEVNLITSRIEGTLCEYGQKEFASELAYSQIQERGELVISENAIRKLKAYYEA